MKPLTFARLGNLGGLGNSLFQIASTVGVARTLNRPVRLPESFVYRPFFSMPDEWFGDLTSADEVAPYFWDMAHPRVSRRWARYGQNPNLFSHCADEIRSAFAPSPRAQAVLDSLPEPGPDDVAVHVRRGDYLTMPLHLPFVGLTYYARAWDEIERGIGQDRARMEVFTDDPEWCAEAMAGWPVVSTDASGHDSTEPRDWLDMHRMARYGSLVIANSSYSWFAAFLAGPDATVIFPDRWFGSAIDVPSPSLARWTEVAV